MMLIDSWMPIYDFVERHETLVRAPCAQVYSALRTSDFSRHPAIRLLLGLRALPALIVEPARARRRLMGLAPGRPLVLETLVKEGFALLEESADREVVLGLTGRFWALAGGRVHTDPALFRDPPPPGTARAAWNFRLEPLSGDSTRLATQTRIWCAGKRARRRFGVYWLIVRPFSGLIRRIMLKQIQRTAEQGAAAGNDAGSAQEQDSSTRNNVSS